MAASRVPWWHVVESPEPLVRSRASGPDCRPVGEASAASGQPTSHQPRTSHATADSLQFSVSVDSFGDSIDLYDVEDFENPSVSWSAFDSGPEAGEVLLERDGKDVTGSSDDFFSEVTGAQASGSFEATCP